MYTWKAILYYPTPQHYSIRTKRLNEDTHTPPQHSLKHRKGLLPELQWGSEAITWKNYLGWTETQRTDSYTQRGPRGAGRRGWENRESSNEMHTFITCKQTANRKALCNTGSSAQRSVTTQRGGMGWEAGGTFKGGDIYGHPWLIHTDVQQKLTQPCKAIICILKMNFLEKKNI